jgi:hypothetical protein
VPNIIETARPQGKERDIAVSRKGKRSITVDGREYLWWVQEDYEPPFVPSIGKSLRVIDTSGELSVEYHLGQPSDVCHVVVTGRRFRSLGGCGGPHRRFRCPTFTEGPAVTPAHVASLIRWAEERGDAPLEVDYLGQPLRS